MRDSEVRAVFPSSRPFTSSRRRRDTFACTNHLPTTRSRHPSSCVGAPRGKDKFANAIFLLVHQGFLVRVQSRHTMGFACHSEQGRRSCGGSCWHPQVLESIVVCGTPALPCPLLSSSRSPGADRRGSRRGMRTGGGMTQTAAGNAGSLPTMRNGMPGWMQTTSSAPLRSLGMTVKGANGEAG